MYVLPEMRESLHAWWSGLAHHLREAGVERVPAELDEPSDMPVHWLDQDLLLSQTCGYPLTHVLKDRVTLVATPIYEAHGCDGVMYKSMVVVSESLDVETIQDLHQCDVAINNWDSQSGFNSLRAKIAPYAASGERFFARTLVTTSHARSIEAVLAGDAQCAAIDGVTLALFKRHRPDRVAGLRILDQTEAVPGLPYITRSADLWGSSTYFVGGELRARMLRCFANPHST